jgi:hypothetical protein
MTSDAMKAANSIGIASVNPLCSPDIDGISADHYKNAMDELKPLILHILNTIIEELDIPQMLKRGTMTPVLKKNKDRQNPANYRGITKDFMIELIESFFCIKG